MLIILLPSVTHCAGCVRLVSDRLLPDLVNDSNEDWRVLENKTYWLGRFLSIWNTLDKSVACGSMELFGTLLSRRPVMQKMCPESKTS